MKSWDKHRAIRSNWSLRAGLAALLASSALSPAFAIDIAARLSPGALGQQADFRAGAAANAVQAGLAASSNFQAQAALSAANLAKAAQAIKDTTAAQLTARASSQLTLNNAPLSGSAWNGQVLSGLKPINDSDPTLWINAQGLQKDTASATATVKQTAANALLYWQSFDLNKGETLVFDQQDHADWTVLNRVVAGPRDPVTGSRLVASPSMILGAVKAQGSVYVINPNGIIFGPTAQIDVHSLIVSSLDVGNPIMSQGERDSFFLNSGILGNGGSIPRTSFSYNQDDTVVQGDVKIEAGAVISTSLAPRSLSPDAGGFVYLFAPNIENDGQISTPAGETLIVAAQQIQLTPNRYPDGGVASNLTVDADQTFKAVGINTLFGSNTVIPPAVWRRDGPASGQISAPGSVINKGVIDAERGVVILNADFVSNLPADGGTGGIIRADTSITRNGQIFLDARLKLTLDGSIQMLPDENGETIPQSAVSNFSPDQLSALAGKLSMRGRQVDLEPGALVLAPGGSVFASDALANGSQVNPASFPVQARPPSLPIPRIYLAPGATIDVGGLDGITLPMSANLITFKPFGNEFADQPLQRQGALRGTELTVDVRQSGTLNGVDWVGTPLANVVGFANNIPRDINQILTKGGTVQFSAPIGTNGDIILGEGSVINVGGGYVQYEGGVISTSKLLTADGRVVDIARANPLDTFVGVAGVSDEEHPHWGANLTDTFVAPLFLNGAFEEGYVEGHDAGGITLNAAAYALDGTLYGSVVAGGRQRLLGIRPNTATANTVKANPNAMPSGGFLSLTGNKNVLISATATPLPAGFTIDNALPADRASTVTLSATVLSQAEFSKISANFSGKLTVDNGAVLSVLPGGTIALTGGSADIEGDLIARSGTIAIESAALTTSEQPGSPTTSFVPSTPDRPHAFDLKIGADSLLDASGLWVNDTGADMQDLTGGAYIDGGSISLKTDTRTSTCSSLVCTELDGLGTDTPPIVDVTGDIVLSDGSTLDVSSGGRIGTGGQLQLDSAGRVAGKGGSVALQTYVGRFSTASAPEPPTTTPLSATIVLPGSDGTAEGTADALNRRIKASSFAQGGTLTLQTPAIQIGGAVSVAPGAVTLPSDFFFGNAFGAYSLNSVAGSLTLVSGETVTLRQKNFVADDALALLPTGARVSDDASVDFLPDILRAPVNLSLSSTLAPLPAAPYDPDIVTPPAEVALSIADGAVIQGEPGASITVGVIGRSGFVHDEGTSFPVPIAQQYGVAKILGTVTAPGGKISISGGSNSRLWLGTDSRLDASGVALTDDRNPNFHAGKMLAGGMVSVSVETGGQFVGLAGATIDVSGADGAFDILQDGVFGPTFVPTEVWSDAGSISIFSATTLYDGSFLAQPGAPSARGGSLTISVPQISIGTEALTVKAGGKVVPSGLTPASDLSALSGQVYFLADRLNGSGISDLTLSANPAQGDTITSQQSQGKFAPGTITFSGNADIGGLDNLFLDASQIKLADVVAPGNADGCNVCLDARYVALRGAGPLIRVRPQAGTGVLRVSGDTIDIAAGGSVQGNAVQFLSLSGIAETQFVSNGDIRLRVPLANIPPDQTPGTLPAGELITAGDLSFQAQQIYPVSAVDMTLKSTATEGTIRFLGADEPDAAPLSAGGQVTVSAAHIEQGGRLVAPLGVIRLGGKSASDLSPFDPARALLVPTKTVTIAPTSVTSVSLEGQTVPFGITANETSWSYNSTFGQPLSAPPEKKVVVSGAAIDFQSGATIDLRGGGDIQAMEFVPGIGGSRDVLKDSSVFAIVPGYDPSAAPIDLDFLLQQGDALPASGRKVYLSGGPDLPAGYYTLLPAHYATLPGAYRVKLVPNTQDLRVSQNTVLPDGTKRIAGYFADPDAGTRDARTQLFDVQSSAVWRQYSEIDQSSGDAFFGGKTVGLSQLPPPLPVDAGHTVFSAISGLNLDGILQTTPDKGGRGAEFDLAAKDIEVLGPHGTPRNPGILAVDANQLSHLGVDSLLIGGIRSNDEEGEKLTVVANAVEIHNNAASPLEAPEVILVSNVGSGKEDPNAGLHIQLDAESVVQAKGDVADPRQKTVILGDETLTIRGNGALLAVSNGAPLNVVRDNTNNANGEINLLGTDAKTGATGAIIRGASLTLDSTGTIRAGAGVTIDAENILASAKSINIGAVTGSPGGFIVQKDVLSQLEKADTLTLRSLQTINFWGDVTLKMTNPESLLVLDSSELLSKADGAVKINAGEVDLLNSDEAVKEIGSGASNLQINANRIALGVGEKALGGFSTATFSGSSEIAVQDAGTLDGGGAAIEFVTPRFLVTATADQNFTTGGDVTFTGTQDGTPTNASEFGGTFTLTAASIDLSANALVQANSGGVILRATEGDIHLGANARILADGYAQTFFDVTRVASGGDVRLISDHGDIAANATTRVDVSSPAGFLGHAGSIELVAPEGRLTTNDGPIDMDAFGGSLPGDSGGRLIIDARTLGGETLSVPSLFSGEVDVHVRRGSLDLASDIRADRVTITADRGPLTVDRTINASGEKGGTISLFGGRGVTLGADGALLATASDPDKKGGDILIGTEVASENAAADPGVITLQGLIDVSNTADLGKGGSVRLRAPLLASGDDVAIDPLQGEIRGATNVTMEAFREFDASNSAFNGVIDPVGQPGFFGACDATSGAPVCTGTLVEFVQNFALSSAAQTKFASIPSGILHLQPGMELISDGDITVANPWNLGAGFAGPLYSAEDYTVHVNKQDVFYPAGTRMTDDYGVLLTDFAKYKGGLIYAPGDLVIPEMDADGVPVRDASGHVKPVLIPGESQIRYLDYRVGGSVTGEPGALTLRAGGKVAINASITDGFFNTRNVFDDDYRDALTNWLNLSGVGVSTNVTNVGGYLMGGATLANPVGPNLGPLPQAPYDPLANAISPEFSGKDKIAISGADLFPLIRDDNGPIQGFDGNYRAVDSWSYRIAAGAETDSANPLGLRPLNDFPDVTDNKGNAVPGAGDVVIDGHTTYNVLSAMLGSNITYATPTIVRTGTGSIDIAAGHDFILADDKAPGAVYTAGRNSTDLPDPGFAVHTIEDPLRPGKTINIAEATNPAGFLKPNPLLCDLFLDCNPYGPLTQAAYPVDAGHLTLIAQQDILGFEHPTIQSPSNGVTGVPNQQYFAPWLLAQGTALANTDFGPFAPLSAYLTMGSAFTPEQTSWWVNFGSFDQGLMSAGGDVYVRAGRDIQELSVSLPTTARVSGGLSPTIIDGEGHVVANIPVVHLNESGDMTVIAGRNLLSGAYYEGSGHAVIKAGGSVSASWSQREDFADRDSPEHPVSTVLALDTGTIELTARRDLDIAGIVSGPSLQNVGDPTESLNVSSASVSSYGPSSKVTLQSVAGDVRINSMFTSQDFPPSALIENQNQLFNLSDSGDAFPGVNFYPASFDAAALKGDVRISDSFALAASDDGTLNLLAGGSLFDSNLEQSRGGARPISTGPSLVETMFDADAPLTGLGPEAGSPAFDLGSRLLHADDSTPNRIYAVNGDFVSGSGAAGGQFLTDFPLAWEINKPTKVRAARDIVDLSFFGQNLAPDDVTEIVAGRDIYYTGAWQILSTQNSGFGIPSLTPMNLGGLSLAGPGTFYVEAGRNLGPIVTAAGDIIAGQSTVVPDSTGTGIITFGNTVVVGNRLMLSDRDPVAANQFAASANDKLLRQGANIVALFGVAKDADYTAMIAKYIDPGTSTSLRNYLPDLVVYLQTLGYPAQSESEAWTTFQSLPDTLQHVFVDKVFFSELRVPGDAKGCCFKQYDIGYTAIETLFPASKGYTDNFENGNAVADTVKTGNLDLLHATIKTLQSGTQTVREADNTLTNVEVGGDIALFGPGGSINVGTTAVEVNKLLTNSALGILTLDNGVIDTFTDLNVLVNQSRILTVQGGDILMWSSNGDLDAGRGAKTTVDFKPLSVIFSPSDLQTINLNGLVSGAGIGTIQSTPDAPAASAFLIAPRGAVNAGDAGLRSSGDLSIAALLVLNAANIASVGTVSGVPEVASVNLGALESSSAVSGQASQAAEAAVAAAANRGQQGAPNVTPSLVNVEVYIGCDPDAGMMCQRQ